MMLKFKNAHPSHRETVLWINSEHIVAVYEEASTQGGSLSTKIYGPTGIVWDVEESVSEVIRAISTQMLVE